MHGPRRFTVFPYTTLFRSRCTSAKMGARKRLRAQSPPQHRRTNSRPIGKPRASTRSEEHTSELQSLTNLVCRLLLEKKNERGYRDFGHDLWHRSLPPSVLI